MTETAVDILEQFARGDAAAFEELFREYQGQVYGWIVRIVRDPAAAEDLTVETFWRIHQARARFDPRCGFGPWARRIATNLAIGHLGVRRTETEFSDDAPPASARSSPPDPAVSADVRQKVAEAFGKLPAKLRAAATLAMIEEEPYTEIGAALGISVGAVKSRVFRATRLLRKSLIGAGVEP
ncbi:MAG TPA: sigma-70 family RNA polymerase sigma factor [Bryobacteraceae bacterium]|nr:sigma-70 family RNA polymerase sigma factor [Bryobacteraceae bacterium]